MKKIINYEKDIIFKTNIGEICSISLEHDFTVDDGKLTGDFIVSGEYKTNELSINRESFNYKLPLEYELEENTDISTLTYDIENFEYNVKDDELNIYIDFGVRYDEIKIEPLIPKIDESELNSEVKDEKDIINEEVFEDDFIFDIPKLEEIKEDKKNNDNKNSEERIRDSEKEIVLNNALEEDAYITYHVHIVREGETIETIAAKYNSKVEIIKEYNNTESVEVKSKLIVPEISNE